MARTRLRPFQADLGQSFAWHGFWITQIKSDLHMIAIGNGGDPDIYIAAKLPSLDMERLRLSRSNSKDHASPRPDGQTKRRKKLHFSVG